MQVKSNDKEINETIVPDIMKKDGVASFKENICPINDIYEVINKNPKNISWSERLVNTDSNSATLIHQMPGEGNRLHHHPYWNEWWFIISGEAEVQIGKNKYVAKRGDIITFKKYVEHKITVLGNVPCIRLAVAIDNMIHTYKMEK